MAPVLLAGFPSELTESIRVARDFAVTGIPGDVVSPLFTLLLRTLMTFIDWKSAVSFALVSSVTMSLAVIPLWWSIRRVLNAKIAWVAVTIFCLMPMHWQEAVNTGSYPLAFLLLFSGFALYLALVPRSRFAAVASLGLCYGLVLAAHHAFITFLPWFLLVYLWERRSQWKKALLELVLCGMAAYAGFVLPLLPAALQPNLSAAERFRVLLPVRENLLPPSEVYGDDYAYNFLKKEFDEKLAREAESPSFFERRSSEHFRINYGIGSVHPLRVLMSSTWLFANSLTALFMQETVGGAFLWLFIVPGICVLWRTKRRLLLQLTGLWLSMELLLRFFFHYGRIHLMDTGWIVAILAGIGVMFVADAVHRSAKIRLTAVAATMTLLIGMQLIQENRKLLAHEYARSTIPRAYTIAEALQTLPKDAVIARPLSTDQMIFTERPTILLHQDTIDVLATKGKVADPFRHYNVTHIIGYDAVRTALIRKAVPSMKVVSIPEKSAVPLTPFTKYLLNLIR
jgi:hypothetical protein